MMQNNVQACPSEDNQRLNLHDCLEHKSWNDYFICLNNDLVENGLV